MLILTRRFSETICIGDDIQVTVLSNHHGEVRLGVQAPKNVAIHRQEVYDRILSEHGHVMSGVKERREHNTGGLLPNAVPRAPLVTEPPQCVGHSVDIGAIPKAPTNG